MINGKVNHPSHYTAGSIEVIDYVKDQLTPEEFRGYIKGNILRYVSRERHKNGDEDLEKALFYLNYLLGKDPRSTKPDKRVEEKVRQMMAEGGLIPGSGDLTTKVIDALVIDRLKEEKR